MNFYDHLLLSIIDKALIGVLIGLLGLSANIVLEKFKSNLAWKSEVGKQRIASISEVWKSFYLWNKAVNDAVASLRGDIPSNQQEKEEYIIEFERLDDMCEDLMNKAINTAEENRFWIAEEYYNFITFQQSIMTYRRVIQKIISSQGSPEKNPELLIELANAEEKRNKAMAVVFDFVKR